MDQAFEFSPPPPLKGNKGRHVKSSIGEFDSITAAARAAGLRQNTVSARLKKGWTIDEALELKSKPKPKPKRTE